MDGGHRQFTWRTIQTWYSRYKRNGITTMQPKPRGDKGSFRKSRAQFFTHENTTTLLAGLRSAFYKRGIPDALYVDNGSIYTSKGAP